VDYRRLNAITTKDSYPLPLIDNYLNALSGSSWFSTLDLRSGYHNIPIAEDDRVKSAFITRSGCFRFNVMPFGMACAPSVFQRLMDFVLCGIVPNVPDLSRRYYCFRDDFRRTTGISRRSLRPNTKGEFEVKTVEMFAMSTKLNV